MSFLEPKDLCVGDIYKLTEFVESKKISGGNFFLVSMEQSPKDGYRPLLGFSKSKNCKAKIFLSQLASEFGGDPAWRRIFKANIHWEAYEPIGGTTWEVSWVVIEKIEKVV